MTIIQHDLIVQKARPLHAARISSVLSAGFLDDPVFRWAMPGDERRRAALPAFFDAFVAGFAPFDETYTTETVAGAALWAPPGAAPEIDDVDIDEWPRMLELVQALESTHPHEECWYLNLLAVDPSSQGRGIGSALLKAVTAQADEQGARCYLEATSEHNRRLYERHAFVATATIEVGNGCPPLWAMWRDPS